MSLERYRRSQSAPRASARADAPAPVYYASRDCPCAIAAGAAETPVAAAGVLSCLKAFVELTKLRLTVAVTLTTAAGYLLAVRGSAWDLRLARELGLAVLGVFLLAAGAAGLNQWQERALDARMRRTRGRPLPSGRLDPSWALLMCGALLLLGLYCLASLAGDVVVLLALGGLAAAWYNGVYTYLKRVTAFAVFPGALIGALPPCIGYVAGGGSLRDPTILLFASFFFIWQVPHFWLLLLIVGDEYRAAGLPTITGKFTPPQLARITFIWMLATAVSVLAFPALSPRDYAGLWGLALVMAAVWLAAKSLGILRVPVAEEAGRSYRRAFRQINVFALLVLVCLVAGALTGR